LSGGSSGIGLAAAKIFASRGAKVKILDLNPPEDESGLDGIEYTRCDITDWKSLRNVFATMKHIDIAVANAGVSQECDYFEDTFDANGELEEPRYAVIEVNYRAVLNFVKLSLSAFRKQAPGSSLVITSSATAYSPEQSLPVYSATKTALIGLVRALRPSIHLYGATINAVAPAATITKLLPANLAAPIMKAGAPVSDAHHVGLAVAYSAVATQSRQVEGYGLDTNERIGSPGRWNGRVILTLGDKWTELEGPISDLKDSWLGAENVKLTAFQQKLTDMRHVKT